MPSTGLSTVSSLERRQDVRHALLRSRSLLAQAEDLGDFGIWEFEIPGLKLTCSPRAYRIFEHPGEPLLTLDVFFSFFEDEAAATIRRCFLTAVAGANGVDETLPFRSAKGKPGWLRIMARTTTGVDGVLHLIGLVKDVTQQRDTERHLRALAYQDGLTGLPNRRHFQDRMTALTTEVLNGRPFALMVIDLDDFRSINDAQGHASGDAVLTEFAARLACTLAPAQEAARIGGDEFAILLPGIDDSDAARGEARALRAALLRRIGEAPAPSFAMGISLYPRDGGSPDDVCKAADMALLHAKSSGRNQTQIFRPDIREDAERRRRIATELREALAQRQLVAHYQPIVDLRTRIIRGWEALVRWQHPRRGLLQPGDFLPHVDTADLAVAIDRHMLDLGLAQLRRWLEQGHAVTCVGINMSAHQMRRDGFVQEIVGALTRHDLAPDRLKIEILENAFFGPNVDKVADTIERLKDLGVVCSLDDFGTGYASLTHLKQFKVERIKIDRSFIKNITHDFHDMAITRSVIDLGRNLGIRVTAEGIETLDQLRLVQSFGCDCGQGYLFGRPMPPDEVPAMLTRWHAGRAAEILGPA